MFIGPIIAKQQNFVYEFVSFSLIDNFCSIDWYVFPLLLPILINAFQQPSAFPNPTGFDCSITISITEILIYIIVAQLSEVQLFSIHFLLTAVQIAKWQEYLEFSCLPVKTCVAHGNKGKCVLSADRVFKRFFFNEFNLLWLTLCAYCNRYVHGRKFRCRCGTVSSSSILFEEGIQPFLHTTLSKSSHKTPPLCCLKELLSHVGVNDGAT